MSLTLSPKYGLNPSMLCCMVCTKEYGIALHGKSRGGDLEAPRHTLHGFCTDCEKFSVERIAFVQVVGDVHNPERTGVVAWVPMDRVSVVLRPAEFAEQVLRAKMAFVPMGAWGKLGLPENIDESKPVDVHEEVREEGAASL